MEFNNFIETYKMIEEDLLDIRTITMGISLLDCIDSDPKRACQRIYDKMMKKSENFIETSQSVSKKYGVPIINNRISVTPISLIAGATNLDDYTMYAEVLDKVSKEIGVNFIGGFSALVDKGFNKGDLVLLNSIPNAISCTDNVCSSVNIGSTKAGINMDAVKILGNTILNLAERTKDADSIGCAKLVVFSNAVEDNPFMAGAFHGIANSDTVISVGISGPGTVKSALEKVRGESFEVVSDTIKETTFKITRLGQLVGKEIASNLGLEFGIVDLSLAPTPAIGDSVGRILEEIGVDHFGGHGSTAALALLNDAVKKGGIMASSNVGGLSGAFIPVSEDEGVIEAATNGYISFDKLEAMTCVCSVGLDMMAIPGDTPAATMSGIIADEAAIGMVNGKTTAVRVIPVHGKSVGETAHFGGLLGYAPIMDIGNTSSQRFVDRGGRIPPPLHSFKN